MEEKRLSDRDQTADVSTREEVEIYGKNGERVRMKKRERMQKRERECRRETENAEERERTGNERILLLPGRVK